jgi:predicted porin
MSKADVGEIRLGRQYILSDGVLGQSNPFGNVLMLNPGTGVTSKGKSLPFFLNAPRVDNAITLYGANFTQVKYSAAAGGELNLRKLAVGARYGLSKNTFLYTSLSQAGGDLKGYITAERVMQLGVRTAF